MRQQITESIPKSIRAKLQESSLDDAITLRSSASLEMFSWEWIEIDGRLLMLRNPVVRSPMSVSEDAWGYPILREPTHVLLIGDPNSDENLSLPGARKEISAIADIYGKHPGII